jgi:RNA polymerase sigma-70 factor (ECF subfamily)
MQRRLHAVNDDELMARVAQGDETSFRTLVEAWQRPVFAFLQRMTGSREEADDLGQEVFLRVFRDARRYKPEGHFRAWLFRIAGNLARSHLRRRRILRWVRFDAARHERPAPQPGPAGEHEARARQEAVRVAIARLPARQRQALLMRRYEEMSYREIARSMGITVPAVESLLQRALRTLRETLGREGLS